MEKKVLFTELDDRGSHLRKEITPTAVIVTEDKRPAGMFWDANKTMNTIVAGATSASDTLEKAENNLNNEIARATAAEEELLREVNKKANNADLLAHTTNTSIHVSQELLNRISAIEAQIRSILEALQ